MSSEEAPRILKVTVEYGNREQAIRVPHDAGTPQSVTISLSTGGYVRVNADGGSTFTAADGRSVTVNADGEVQAASRATVRVHGRNHDVDIRGSVQGAQFGTGNMQTNVW